MCLTNNAAVEEKQTRSYLIRSPPLPRFTLGSSLIGVFVRYTFFTASNTNKQVVYMK